AAIVVLCACKKNSGAKSKTPPPDIEISKPQDEEEDKPCVFTNHWQPVLTYQYTPGKDAQANAIQIASDDQVYVAGYANDQFDDRRWVVLASEDGGSSWTVSDNYLDATGVGQATSLALGSANEVYAAGVI